MVKIKVLELENHQISCFIIIFVGPTTADLHHQKGFTRKGQQLVLEAESAFATDIESCSAQKVTFIPRRFRSQRPFRYRKITFSKCFAPL